MLCLGSGQFWKQNDRFNPNQSIKLPLVLRISEMESSAMRTKAGQLEMMNSPISLFFLRVLERSRCKCRDSNPLRPSKSVGICLITSSEKVDSMNSLIYRSTSIKFIFIGDQPIALAQVESLIIIKASHAIYNVFYTCDYIIWIGSLLSLKISFYPSMKAYQYEEAIGEIIPEFVDCFQLVKEEKADMELEIKYGKLKKSYNQNAWHGILKSSIGKTIVLNFRNDHKNHKINANASKEEMAIAQLNLKELCKKKEYKIEANLMFTLNQHQQKFNYNVTANEWEKHFKEQMINRQFDVVSDKKMFRINFSKKIIQHKNVFAKLKANMDKYISLNGGLFRFKKEHIYHVNQDYNVTLSYIYESQLDSDYQKVKKVVLAGGDKQLGEITAKIFDEQMEADKFIKTELELRFTDHANKLMQEMDQFKLTKYITKAFDFFKDLTDKKKQEDITAMMNALSLQKEKGESK